MGKNELVVVQPSKRTKIVKIEKKNKEGRVLAVFDYAKVSARVAEFNKGNSNGSIRTEHQVAGTYTLFKATVVPDVKNPDRYFTGTSMGKLGNEKALEKLETIAVGRALAFAGFLSDGEIASSEEMAKYEESPVVVECEVAIAQLNGAKTQEELKKIWLAFTPDERANAEVMAAKDRIKEFLPHENTQSGTEESGMASTPKGEGNGDGSEKDSGDTSGKK